ncbi:nucleoside hydrolase [Granulicoccus phenolivorans]|uniref:nucleoside hydrolase n=1 Tax=Granulicoccus phenolivorans TaxID=266854 RepID=UPI0004265F71|nr:nucleoside hydrolase [Granulicoccus phenolivorans]
MRLIADVDTGIDDALALVWLAAQPEVELVAVTTCAGNTDADQAAANSLGVLQVCGRDDVEVAVGARAPLRVPLVTVPETHGPTGLGYARLPEPNRALSPRPALEVWLEEVRRHPGETTLLLTGPVTNLAVALDAEPDLPDLLGSVVIMGGGFDHPGNTTPSAEFNAWADPHALARVLAAWQGRPVDRLPVLCSLQVTEQIVITPQQLTAMTAALDAAPVPRLLTDALRFYFEFHEEYGYGYLAMIHDLLAAQVAAGALAVPTTPQWVGVETESELMRGTTVRDARRLWGYPPNARIVDRADPHRVLDLLAAAIAALGAGER